jgi:hypothetical protein
MRFQRLRPLDPVFDVDKSLGALTVGNGTIPCPPSGGGLYDAVPSTFTGTIFFGNMNNPSTPGRGTWQEMPTSGDYVNGIGLTYAANSFLLQAGANGTQTASRILDVAVGAPGAQVAIAENLLVYHNESFVHSYYLVHRHIAAGTRIWVRQYNSTAAANTWVSILPMSGFPVGPEYQILNLNLGADAVPSSLGTSVTQNAATWTQLTTSAPDDIEAVMLKLSGRTGTSAWGRIRLAAGAAGFEVPLPVQVQFGGAQSGSEIPFLPHIWIPCKIAAGTRVTAQAYASSAGTDAWRVVAYGLKELP